MLARETSGHERTQWIGQGRIGNQPIIEEPMITEVYVLGKAVLTPALDRDLASFTKCDKHRRCERCELLSTEAISSTKTIMARIAIILASA